MAKLRAAMNPGPWGCFDDPIRECTCVLSMVSRYRKRPLQTVPRPDTRPHPSTGLKEGKLADE